MSDSRVRPLRTSQSGFTLAELLLASVLGAMLLSSLAVTTFGFAHTLDYMEDEAGVNADADPVLRRITKEIREAWWVEHPEQDRIEIADANGAMTSYYVEGDDLWVERPNGDTGILYGDFLDFTMESATMERLREDTPVNMDGVFFSASAAGTPGVLVAQGPGAIALGFAAPAAPKDVPGQPVDDEQIQSVQTSVFDLPIAFYNGSGTPKVAFEIYEGWAPGKARPNGNLLASTLVNGTDLPAAVAAGSSFEVPVAVTPVSITRELEPGVGYTLVIKPQGTNKIVLKSIPVAASVDVDEVAKLSGSTWSNQNVLVPFSVRGPWVKSATLHYDVVNLVTLTAYPVDRPLQQRSAAILSQAMTEDPWLGVVPGEVAP